MREIKFRAWDIEKNKMITGKEEGLMIFLLMDECCVIRPLIKQEDDDWFLKGDFGGKYILMQYSGMKDKNGKEIFEGDIVIHHYFHETGTVIWQQNQSRYALEYLSDKNTQELFPIDTAMFEILGNIYQNPELLK